MQYGQAFRLFKQDRIADRRFFAQFPEANGSKFAVADFVPEMPAEIGVKLPRVSILRCVVEDGGQQGGGVEFVKEDLELLDGRLTFRQLLAGFVGGEFPDADAPVESNGGRTQEPRTGEGRVNSAVGGPPSMPPAACKSVSR